MRALRPAVTLCHALSLRGASLHVLSPLRLSPSSGSWEDLSQLAANLTEKSGLMNFPPSSISGRNSTRLVMEGLKCLPLFPVPFLQPLELCCAVLPDSQKHSHWCSYPTRGYLCPLQPSYPKFAGVRTVNHTGLFPVHLKCLLASGY